MLCRQNCTCTTCGEPPEGLIPCVLQALLAVAEAGLPVLNGSMEEQGTNGSCAHPDLLARDVVVVAAMGLPTAAPSVFPADHEEVSAVGGTDPEIILRVPRGGGTDVDLGPCDRILTIEEPAEDGSPNGLRFSGVRQRSGVLARAEILPDRARDPRPVEGQRGLRHEPPDGRSSRSGMGAWTCSTK